MQPQLLRTALGHTLLYTGEPAESSPVGRHQIGAPTHIGLDHLVTAVCVCVTSSGVFVIGVVNCVFTHSHDAEHSSGAYCVVVRICVRYHFDCNEYQYQEWCHSTMWFLLQHEQHHSQHPTLW